MVLKLAENITGIFGMGKREEERERVEGSVTVTQVVGSVPIALNLVNRVPGVVDRKAVIGRRTTRSGGERRASCILTFSPYFFLSYFFIL